MRFLDITLAAVLGLAAITGVSVWSPGPGDLGAHRLQERSVLRDSLASFVGAKGMAWFAAAPLAEICASVSASSNSTFALSAEINSSGCGGEPSKGSVSAELSFNVSSRQVTLRDWSGAGA